MGFESSRVEDVPCAEGLEACPGWDPGSYIEVAASGTVEVDSAFVDSVVQNPEDVVTCDAGYIDVDGPNFVVRRASAGEFLYELGFRDGDIIIGVNGMPLTSYDEAAAAFGDLYLGGATSFRFEVQRGGSLVVFLVELV